MSNDDALFSRYPFILAVRLLYVQYGYGLSINHKGYSRSTRDARLPVFDLRRTTSYRYTYGTETEQQTAEKEKDCSY
jgi:hypothetical protein